jgi:hypothetical protein
MSKISARPGTATAVAMSNPSAENVDALFNIIIDLMLDTTNNTNGQAVEQKHFVLPASEVIQPHISTQHQGGYGQNSELWFYVRTIIPFSHFQWPVLYPKLLHPPPS